MQIKKWMCGEIRFSANDTYERPFYDVDLTVEFTHESGKKLTRPGFWLEKDIFAVRFAPTELGVWNYKTICSNRADSGLHNVCGTIECIPYDGELDIYKHGFVKVSENKRYFVYDDGTPFFYLGDTHWLMPTEPFDTSNAEGIDSTFRFMVDYRITQGFTVYQSEPLSPPALTLYDGFGDDDAAAFKDNFDRKFAYIAEKGLLHTNAQLFFASNIQDKSYTAEYLVRLTRMWSARYGAYPVLWTVAQEVDPDFYNHANIDKWIIVGETLYQTDCYKHPLTGHMCNENRCHPDNTKWGDKYYHSWFGMQPQGCGTHAFEEFYNYKITKPIINYETGYEHLWSDEHTALNAGYRSFLNGAFGYGYGAHGVWNGNISINRWMDYDGYMRWMDGLFQPGAKKLWFFRQFFESIEWYKLKPQFLNKEVWNASGRSVLSKLDDSYLIFNYGYKDDKIELYDCEEKEYSLLAYSVDDGVLADLGKVQNENGKLTLPDKQDDRAYVLILTSHPEKFNIKLNIYSESLEALLKFKGDTLQLVTNKNAKLTVSDEAVATVSENGILTAQGKNGFVKVFAETDNERAERTFLCVRQNETEPPRKAEKIIARPFRQKEFSDTLTSPMTRTTVLPEFYPDNIWHQYPELHISDLNGNKSYIVLPVRNYLLNPIYDGECYVWFEQDGVESEKVKLTLSGYGTSGLLLGAKATSSDYNEKYDPRCLPQRVTNGDKRRFSGWCSGYCDENNPVTLTVTPNEPITINNISMCLTDQGYTLRSFDLFITVNGEKNLVASVKDNDKFVLDFDFEASIVEEINVVCYKGDGNGNARIDSIDAHLN